MKVRRAIFRKHRCKRCDQLQWAWSLTKGFCNFGACATMREFAEALAAKENQ